MPAWSNGYDTSLLRSEIAGSNPAVGYAIKIATNIIILVTITFKNIILFFNIIRTLFKKTKPI
jgi:hypothetical protein